jgi:hypothetical protein
MIKKAQEAPDILRMSLGKLDYFQELFLILDLKRRFKKEALLPFRGGGLKLSSLSFINELRTGSGHRTSRLWG